MPNPIVIDMSHWQEDPDWAKLKSNGTVGVILKATEGTGYTDPTYAKRKKAALQAGLLVSSYHWLKAASINAQMDRFLAVVAPVKGERVCIDHEDDASLAQLKQAIQYLLTKRPDLQVTIYSGHLLKQQLGAKNDAYLATYTSLWLAQYTAGSPDWPKGTYPNWSLWQYTDKFDKADGLVGMKGPVDANKWNGSTEALVRWMSPADQTPVPVPTPTPKPKTVTVRVEGPDDVIVEVFINGVKQ